jgi:hypothetical protein
MITCDFFIKVTDISIRKCIPDSRLLYIPDSLPDSRLLKEVGNLKTRAKLSSVPTNRSSSCSGASAIRRPNHIVSGLIIVPEQFSFSITVEITQT